MQNGIFCESCWWKLKLALVISRARVQSHFHCNPAKEVGARRRAVGAASALLSGWRAVSPTVWRRARVPCVMKGRARSASARWRRRDETRHLPGMEACCAITVAEDLVGDQVPQTLTNMRSHINFSAPITNSRLFFIWYRFINVK